MNNITNISIPAPCHQPWQQMTAEGNGRHCTNCSKIVTDFTVMSNSEIINYLSSATQVCGRFTDQQLKGINYQLYANNLPTTGAWKRLLLGLSLLGTSLSFKAAAQTKQDPVEQAPKSKDENSTKAFPLGEIIIASPNEYRVITGNIYDAENIPLPGATVMLPSGKSSITTGANGRFAIIIPTNEKKIQVLFLGFKPLMIDVCTDGDYQVKLTDEQLAWLGEPAIIIKRRSLIKRIYYKCIKMPIRKIFN